MGPINKATTYRDSRHEDELQEPAEAAPERSGSPSRQDPFHAMPQQGRRNSVTLQQAYAERAGSPSVGSHTAFDTQPMDQVIAAALISPKPCEEQHLCEDAWRVVYQFDLNRRNTGRTFDVETTFPDLAKIADDDPSCADAKLLRDIVTRPLGEEDPPLEVYLSKKMEELMDVMEIPKDPDPRTFNSIQPDICLSTLPYNSAARTLLLKGTMELIGIPSAPASAELTKKELDRAGRLQRTIFSFPKNPADPAKRMKWSNFNVPPGTPDPLDVMAIYESTDSTPEMSRS